MLIEKYNPAWITWFNSLKRVLENGLPVPAIRIEHVGSTAVPELDAKSVIDIDLIHADPQAFPEIRSGLEKLGYYHNGNQGIEGREVFKRSGHPRHPVLDSIRHHLYVCPAASQALERHLLLRDHLRKNEQARLAYQQMKYELAEKAGQDRKRYAALKEIEVNPFIDSIIEEEKRTGPDGMAHLGAQ